MSRTQQMSRLRTRLGAAAVVILTGLLGACASGGSADDGSPAASGPGLEAANQLLAQYSTAPADIGITQPVGAPIPGGKKIGFIQCPVSSCQVIAGSMEQAAASLGWSVSAIKTSGTPDNLQAAFNQAIREGVDAVAYTGFPRSSFDAQIKQLAAEGKPVVACCVTDPVEDGITYNIRGDATGELEGKMMAAYAATRSRSGDAAAFVSFPVYPVLVTVQKGWEAAMHEFAPGVATSDLEVALSDVGVSVPQKVVNFLRANPKVSTLSFATDDLVLGVPQALKAAGLADKVTIIGKDTGPTNLQYIKSGQQAMSIPSPNNELGYYLVDSLARQFAGVSTEPGNVPDPLVIWSKDNAPDNVNQPTVTGFQAQFEKLWGIAP